jgi:hypothetical protein
MANSSGKLHPSRNLYPLHYKYEAPTSNGEILLAYNQSYFDIGLNHVTIEAKDSRGIVSSCDKQVPR